MKTKKLNKKEREELKDIIKNIFISNKMLEIVFNIFEINISAGITNKYNIVSNNTSHLFKPVIEERLILKYGTSFSNISLYSNGIYLIDHDTLKILNKEVNVINYIKAITASFDITLYNRIYTIYFSSRVLGYLKDGTPYMATDVDITGKSTDAERIERREKNETNYAVIEKNGKKALVKFISGDRSAINSSKFIKRKKVEGVDDEETMKLLFNLNDDLKGK